MTVVIQWIMLHSLCIDARVPPRSERRRERFTHEKWPRIPVPQVSACIPALGSTRLQVDGR